MTYGHETPCSCLDVYDRLPSAGVAVTRNPPTHAMLEHQQRLALGAGDADEELPLPERLDPRSSHQPPQHHPRIHAMVAAAPCELQKLRGARLLADVGQAGKEEGEVEC